MLDWVEAFGVRPERIMHGFLPVHGGRVPYVHELRVVFCSRYGKLHLCVVKAVWHGGSLDVHCTVD